MRYVVWKEVTVMEDVLALQELEPDEVAAEELAGTCGSMFSIFQDAN
jgi:hypothetical protein